MGETNEWNEWSRHVLAELERLSDNQDKLSEHMADVRADIKVLYFKAGIIGLLGGMIPVATMLLIQVFFK